MTDKDIFLAGLVHSGVNRESFKIGDVNYEMAKLPALDSHMTLPTLIFKVTKSIIPFMKPLLALYADISTTDEKGIGDLLKTDIKEFIKDERIDLFLENVSKVDEETLLYIFNLAIKLTCKPMEKKAIDAELLLTENPQHYTLLIYHFLKIQVSPIFLGRSVDEKQHQQTEMRII